jgi:hypothetical protein
VAGGAGGGALRRGVAAVGRDVGHVVAGAAGPVEGDLGRGLDLLAGRVERGEGRVDGVDGLLGPGGRGGQQGGQQEQGAGGVVHLRPPVLMGSPA